MMLAKSKFKNDQYYRCVRWKDGCRGSHGAHPDGMPLGIPADTETKSWRMRAHQAFDQFWKHKKWTRPEGYQWMQRVMNLSEDDAHIGKFTSEQCEQLILIVNREIENNDEF